MQLGLGLVEYQIVSNFDSEEYKYHQGRLQTEGVHVYIMDYTPFRHKLPLS